MALPATMRRFTIDLADVDREHYASLDLRVAQHPSESDRYLITRVIARALEDAEGMEFSRGLCVDDEPAIWQRNPRGELMAWIEVGGPSRDRLHRAQKASPRVAVYGWHRMAALAEEAADVFAADRLEIYEFPSAAIDTLVAGLDRNNRWSLSVTGGSIYADGNGRTVEFTRTHWPVAASR